MATTEELSTGDFFFRRQSVAVLLITAPVICLRAPSLMSLEPGCPIRAHQFKVVSPSPAGPSGMLVPRIEPHYTRSLSHHGVASTMRDSRSPGKTDISSSCINPDADLLDQCRSISGSCPDDDTQKGDR
jgi:hypothetical protein